jgi:hypothetical protein
VIEDVSCFICLGISLRVAATVLVGMTDYAAKKQNNSDKALSQPCDLTSFFISFAQEFNCSGPVAVDNIRYTNETLVGLQVSVPLCASRTYEGAKKGFCGIPNYSVNYCLERLDVAAAVVNGVGRGRASAGMMGYWASLMITLFMLL